MAEYLLPLLGFFYIVLLPKAFYAAGGIHQLLLAGEEGMAGGTDFHLDIPYGRTSFDHIPAGAGYFCHLIFGMNLLSHILSSGLSNSKRYL
jgi:hypothetical protein